MSLKKYAFLSEKAPDEMKNIIEYLGYGCVLLPGFKNLPAPAASHADMLFFRLGNRKLLCDKRYYSENEHLFSKTEDIGFVYSQISLYGKYPDDIWLDSLVYQGKLYGKKHRIAPEILEVYQKVNFVKQGYAGCSVLCTDKLAVTADAGIYGAIKANGDKVMKIPEENILLDGYDRGFIGGASGFDAAGGTVVFSGDPAGLSSGKVIVGALESSGYRVLDPKGEQMKDIGGVRFID